MKRCLMLSLIFSAILPAQNFGRQSFTEHEIRRWQGKNGKSLYASFFHKIDDSHVELVTETGKGLKIALENLSVADQEYVAKLIEQLEAAKATKAERTEANDILQNGLLDGFKADSALDRMTIHQWDQKNDKVMLGNSVLALWTGLVWWDSTEFLQIPSRGDAMDRRGWLQEKLAKELRYGPGDTISLKRLSEELPGILNDEYGDLAAFRILNTEAGYGYEVIKDDPLKKASNLMGKSCLAILMMSISNDRGNEFSDGGLVESIDEKGNLVLHIEGKRLVGKLIPTGNNLNAGAQFEIRFLDPLWGQSPQSHNNFCLIASGVN